MKRTCGVSTEGAWKVWSMKKTNEAKEKFIQTLIHLKASLETDEPGRRLHQNVATITERTRKTVTGEENRITAEAQDETEAEIVTGIVRARVVGVVQKGNNSLAKLFYYYSDFDI